jgi:23S rRNA pseudouridine2605 synthase
MAEERLQKVLANAGVASRRTAEEMIKAGRVTVNGQVVTQLGTKVDPARDMIAVDGNIVAVGAGRIYVLLNKPVGVISSASDRWGRKTVLDLVGLPGRVYPVGRLDLDSEGLILLTNDGEVTNVLTHPRYGQQKTYLALVRGEPSDAVLEQMTRGVELPDGTAKAQDVRRIAGVPNSAPGMTLRKPEGMTWLEITLLEGRKREIRRMLEKLGHPVERLIRIRMGPLTLGRLAPGEWRHLTPAEVRALRALVEKARKPQRLQKEPKPARQARPSARRTSRPTARRNPSPRKERGGKGQR